MSKNDLKKLLKQVRSSEQFKKLVTKCDEKGYMILFKSNASPVIEIDKHFHNKNECVVVNKYGNVIPVKWSQLNKLLTFEKLK